MKRFKEDCKKLFAAIFVTRVIIAVAFFITGASPIGAASERVLESPSLEALKECLKKSGQTEQCLDGLFREFLIAHSTAEALELLRGYENVDPELRLSCHPVAHAIGRETFRQKGTIHGAFAACDQTCHSGCYHGAVERFIRGEGGEGATSRHVSLTELRGKAPLACSDQTPVSLRFQCLHGLGHAILYFTHYELRDALSTCDALPDEWGRSSCYGGVFMENVFSATPDKRDVDAKDYHYPCNKVDLKYRSDCYMIQTWRMAEMGLSTNRLFEECKRAGVYRSPCMQSIGRDLSNEARIKKPRLAAEKCELVESEDRRACLSGVVYALIDNTWDGRYAFPFCAALRSTGDISYCFEVSANYLNGTFDKPKNEIRDECKKYLAQPKSCMDTVGR